VSGQWLVSPADGPEMPASAESAGRAIQPKSVNFFYRLLQAMLFAINFEDITI
jgi:hypothetical protein